MLNRQQRDKLVASLQSVEELWETAAGIDAVQNNIIIEILRVADDVYKGDYSATRCVFICMFNAKRSFMQQHFARYM